MTKTLYPYLSTSFKLYKTSHTDSSQSCEIPQADAMYPSHQWTIPSNPNPPLSMATHSPLSTTSNLSVQTHILEPSFQPNTLNVPTCLPLSSPVQNFGGTDLRYGPKQLFIGKRARIIYQLGPEPASSDHEKT